MKKVVFFLLSICLFMTGCSVKKVEELTDAERFANEFDISKKNPFVYTSSSDVIQLFESGTGIVFFANSDQEGSIKAADLLYQASLKEKVDQIYYLNLEEVKKSDPKEYKKIVKIISDYLGKDYSNRSLSFPEIFSIKEGKIIAHSNYFSKKEQLSEEVTRKKMKQIEKEYICLLRFDPCISS